MAAQDKRRILHIITSLALGGAQKNALYISESLDKEKYIKHFISAPIGGLYGDIGNYNDINFYFLPFLKRTIAPVRDFFAFFAIALYIQRHKIMIVHTHSSKAGILGRWAAKICGVPIIVHTIHGWSFHDRLPNLLKQFFIFLERWTAKMTTAFIAVSKHDIERGLENSIGRAGQYQLVRYGIDMPDVSARDSLADIKETFNLGKQVRIIGMIACLKPQKNPLDFLRMAEIVLKSMPEARFVLAGDGILMVQIEEFIKEHQLDGKVILLGWRRDIPELLAAMDVVVLTSLWEGLPIALLEAMAAGKPIVAYNTDGVREIVHDNETGYLIDQEDVPGLAEGVLRLLKDRESAVAMGARGARMIAAMPYRAKDMMRGIEILYEKLSKETSHNGCG